MIDWNTIPINESSLSLVFSFFGLGIGFGLTIMYIIINQKKIYQRFHK